MSAASAGRIGVGGPPVSGQGLSAWGDSRQAVHAALHRSVVRGYELTGFPRPLVVNRLRARPRAGGPEVELDYSLTYAGPYAAWLWSAVAEVGIDIALRRPGRRPPFFVPEPAVAAAVPDRLDRPLFFWCLQEAIGKLEKTGLRRHHRIVGVRFGSGCGVVAYRSPLLPGADRRAFFSVRDRPDSLLVSVARPRAPRPVSPDPRRPKPHAAHNPQGA